MGSCCSSDSLPPVPKVIQFDPDVNSSAEEVVIKNLGGMFSFSRDYGIWNKQYPDSSEDRREKIWLWLNKGSIGNRATIDLENFVRGTKSDKDKGKVLCSAEFEEKPFFQTTQRVPATSGFDKFIGIFTNDVSNYEDHYYVTHHTHTSKIPNTEEPDGRKNNMITKFQLNTHATITGGDTGRFEGTFDKDPLILEVYATGTAVTTWTISRRQVEDRDQEGKVTGHHEEIDHHKHETEFVDRVEFRLSFRGSILDAWYLLGDSFQWANDPNVACALFTAVQEGGFFKPSLTKVNTTGKVDSALAILVAHICTTEFSVASVKMKFTPQTSSRPPPDAFSFATAQNLNYASQFVQNNAASFELKF